MIIARLKDAQEYYKLGKNMETALKFIENNDFASFENGRHEIDGSNVYAIVQDYETKAISEGKWEAHKKYTDIQCVIKGKENMGWGLLENFSAISKYDQEKDIFFLEGEGSFDELQEGYFAIITPEYAHMPSISTEKQKAYVKKVVIKVLLNSK